MLSPLRYPGGKRRMLGELMPRILPHVRKTGLYIEPFVGGGSVALAVAHYDRNCLLHINDADPGVSAFWHVIASADYTKLVDHVLACKPTVELHTKLRTLDAKPRLHRAWRTLFLSRTSFSGIIGAAPIGGAAQKSKWKIDCRWNPDRLAAQITKAHGLLRGRTSVSNYDFCFAMGEGLRVPATIYADPPYIAKGDMCYGKQMDALEHEALATEWYNLKMPGWLSYDDDPWVRERYADLEPIEVPARYSIRGNKKNWTETKELLIPSPVNA